MKFLIFATFSLLISCQENRKRGTGPEPDTGRITGPSIEVEQKEPKKDTSLSPKSYSNKRFKNVMVERIGKDSFLIKGQGQIFEASFNWVVEDGHEELKKGYQMTDAGAPEWGSFKFIIHAPKKRPNSTITLILFESSAKDGTPQYQLPIVLH